MTKQYDIVNIVGNDSFTYQLYKDLSIHVTGNASVEAVVEIPSNSWVNLNQDFDGYYIYNNTLYAYNFDYDTNETLIYTTADEGVSWSLASTLYNGFQASFENRFIQIGSVLWVFQNTDSGAPSFYTSTNGISFSSPATAEANESVTTTLAYFNSDWYGGMYSRSGGDLISFFGDDPTNVDWQTSGTIVKTYTAGGRLNNPIIYNGNLYYLNSRYSGSFYMSSANGTDWTEVPLTTTTNWPSTLNRVNTTVHNGKITFGSSTGLVWQTEDVMVWTQLNITNSLPSNPQYISTGTKLFAYVSGSSLYYLEEV